MNVFIKIALIAAVSSLAITTHVFAKENVPNQPGVLKRIFNINTPSAIGSCTITAVSGMTITCTQDGTTYTVQTSEGTQFRRRFWGKSEFSELKVGDQINVIGHWSNDAHTAIAAKHVRDISIQMRFGVFFGKVLSLTSDGWVMSTKKQGNQTVSVDSSTKLVNQKQEPIAESDIAVGSQVRVKGLWDNVGDTITNVEQVKVFLNKPTP